MASHLVTSDPTEFWDGNDEAVMVSREKTSGLKVKGELGVRPGGVVSLQLEGPSLAKTMPFRANLSYDTTNNDWTVTGGPGFKINDMASGVIKNLRGYNVGPVNDVLDSKLAKGIAYAAEGVDLSGYLGFGMYGNGFEAEGLAAQAQFSVKLPMAEWMAGDSALLNKLRSGIRFDVQVRVDFQTIGDDLTYWKDYKEYELKLFLAEGMSRINPYAPRNYFPSPPVRRDPLVLDLNGDGISLTDLNSSTTRFDLDGNGFAERTGWVSASDGLLARDLNNDGVIDAIGELFGTPTRDGFDVLRDLDSNNDGIISSADTAFNELRIWRDLNGDGIGTSDELGTLSDYGIVSISLSAVNSSANIAGNSIAKHGSFTFEV